MNKNPWRVGQLPERVAGYPEGMTKGSCRSRNLGQQSPADGQQTKLSGRRFRPWARRVLPFGSEKITGKGSGSEREGGDNRAAGESVAAVERRYMMNEPEEAAALSVKIRMAYK